MWFGWLTPHPTRELDTHPPPTHETSSVQSTERQHLGCAEATDEVWSLELPQPRLIIHLWVPLLSMQAPPPSLEGGRPWPRGGLGEVGESLGWASPRKASWRRLHWEAPYLSEGCCLAGDRPTLMLGATSLPSPCSTSLPLPWVHPSERDSVNQTKFLLSTQVLLHSAGRAAAGEKTRAVRPCANLPAQNSGLPGSGSPAAGGEAADPGPARCAAAHPP